VTIYYTQTPCWSYRENQILSRRQKLWVLNAWQVWVDPLRRDWKNEVQRESPHKKTFVFLIIIRLLIFALSLTGNPLVGDYPFSPFFLLGVMSSRSQISSSKRAWPHPKKELFCPAFLGLPWEPVLNPYPICPITFSRRHSQPRITTTLILPANCPTIFNPQNCLLFKSEHQKAQSKNQKKISNQKNLLKNSLFALPVETAIPHPIDHSLLQNCAGTRGKGSWAGFFEVLTVADGMSGWFWPRV